MKIRIYLFALLACLMILPACHAQFGATRTTIRDTIIAPSGRMANGTLTVTAASPFRTYDGWNVGKGATKAKITNGTFQIALAPNLGGAPFGSYYLAQYNFSDGTSAREYWVVPSEGTTIPLSSVRSEFADPSIMIAASQIQPPSPCSTGNAILWEGIAQGWQCGAIQVFGNTNANLFFAGPSGGSPAPPAFRALVPLDYPVFGASGLSHAQGAVPDPGASAGSTRFLREDGNWAVPSGSGGGLGDPGANGIVFRSALNTTRIATASDVIGLFTSCAGVLYLGADGQCHSAGTGTVTSVGLSLPTIFSVSGSPVTTTGTLTASLVNQNANLVLAGPATGSAATPSFRFLVAADIPDLSATYLTVASGATKVCVQQECYTYAADTGTANAYAVSLSPAPTLAPGSHVVFKAAHGNTGASTLSVNGGTAIALINSNGLTALTSGLISTGQMVDAKYDGASFQAALGGGGGTGSGTVSNCTTAGALAYYAATGTTVSCDSSIIDNGAGSLTLAGSLQSGSGSGVAGTDALGQGSAPSITGECSPLGVPCIVHNAPTSVTASYEVTEHGTAASGLVRHNLASSTETEVLAELSGAVATSGSNVTTFGNPVTCSAGQHINAISGGGVPTCTADSGGGGAAAPNTSVSFSSATSATLTVPNSTANITWACFDNATSPNGIVPQNVSINTSTFVVTFKFATAQSGSCTVNSSGSGVYTASESSATSWSVTAATHLMGLHPVIQTFDSSGNLISGKVAVDGSGNVTVAWAVAQAGQIVILP